jgi:Zn-dependent peptidase ImmA (M78 family)
MPQRIEAIINPQLLVWAREEAGLDINDIAEKIKTKPARIRSWESGEEFPSISQLRKIAKFTGRHIAVFYLPQMPKKEKKINDFRVPPNMPIPKLSSNLLFEIRNVRQKREEALELAKILEAEISPIRKSIKIDDDIEKTAIEIRKILGISDEIQFKWNERKIALIEWIAAIEKMDALVFQTSKISNEEMSGFTIRERLLPVIVLNSKDYESRRIFTLMHELAHILLNNGGICSLRFNEPSDSIDYQPETFCNYLAGSILVPRTALLSDRIVSGKRSNRKWTNEELTALANKFCVSREVILRRLLILGKTTKDYYLQKRSDFIREFAKLKVEKKEGRKHWPSEYLRNNGVKFARLVLSAYYRDHINLSDVSDYLGMKLKHLSWIEQKVWQ